MGGASSAVTAATTSASTAAGSGAATSVSSSAVTSASSSASASSSGGPTTPAFVQLSRATPQGNQTTVAATYKNPQTAGNTNILAIGWNDTTASLASVKDSSGNTYQQATPTYTGQYMSQAIWYASNIAAAGANADMVTVSFDMPAAYVDLRIVEYSGLQHAASSFDQLLPANGAMPPAATPMIATTIPNELLFVAGMSSNKFTGPGPKFTSRVVTQDGSMVADAVAVSTGSYDAMPTVMGTWLLQLASFKPGP
jgi:hypothetical protein